MWLKEGFQGTLKGEGWAWGPTVMLTGFQHCPAQGLEGEEAITQGLSHNRLKVTCSE